MPDGGGRGRLPGFPRSGLGAPGTDGGGVSERRALPVPLSSGLGDRGAGEGLVPDGGGRGLLPVGRLPPGGGGGSDVPLGGNLGGSCGSGGEFEAKLGVGFGSLFSI